MNLLQSNMGFEGISALCCSSSALWALIPSSALQASGSHLGRTLDIQEASCALSQLATSVVTQPADRASPHIINHAAEMTSA